MCVPKMAPSDGPNAKFRVFPRWSIWSGGGGASKWGDPPPPAVYPPPSACARGGGGYSNTSLTPLPLRPPPKTHLQTGRVVAGQHQRQSGGVVVALFAARAHWGPAAAFPPQTCGGGGADPEARRGGGIARGAHNAIDQRPVLLPPLEFPLVGRERVHRAPLRARALAPQDAGVADGAAEGLHPLPGGLGAGGGHPQGGLDVRTGHDKAAALDVRHVRALEIGHLMGGGVALCAGGGSVWVCSTDGPTDPSVGVPVETRGGWCDLVEVSSARVSARPLVDVPV